MFGINIRGTRVRISGVRRYEGMNIQERVYAYPGHEGINISGVREYEYPGYKGMNIRGTRVCISGVRGYEYPGYEGINIRGTRG